MEIRVLLELSLKEITQLLYSSQQTNKPEGCHVIFMKLLKNTINLN